jgi:hypothetical protein
VWLRPRVACLVSALLVISQEDVGNITGAEALTHTAGALLRATTGMLPSGGAILRDVVRIDKTEPLPRAGEFEFSAR